MLTCGSHLDGEVNIASRGGIFMTYAQTGWLSDRRLLIPKPHGIGVYPYHFGGGGKLDLFVSLSPPEYVKGLDRIYERACIRHTRLSRVHPLLPRGQRGLLLARP